VFERSYLTAVFCLAAAVCNAGERYVFDVFGLDRGLVNMAVTRLAQDHQGALWVGTENGLYRFDGHRFLRFTTNEGLPNNRITAIHEGPDGTLWVGTPDGLAWKDGAGFRASRQEDLKGFIAPQGIASDSAGRVFISTRQGVAVVESPASGRDAPLRFLPRPSSLPQARATNVYAPSPDTVWFGCDSAICMWNGSQVLIWDRAVGVPAQKWDLFLEDKSSNLWARSRETLIELESGGKRFKTVDPQSVGRISLSPELAMDEEGRVLVSTDRGLAVGDARGWTRITSKQGLPNNIITDALQDSQGSMWLGTPGAGLVRWAGYGAWRTFTELDGLASSFVFSLLGDEASGMWVGTAAGLSQGVFSNGTWTWSEVHIPGVEWASCLVRSVDGSLWMLTNGHYVVQFDPRTRTSRRLGPFAQGPYHIRFDTSGRLWVADSDGVAAGDAKARIDRFERVRPPGASASTSFTSTLEDSHGDLWIGSTSGLFRRSQGKWYRYDVANGLRSNKITDLALSPQGDLWLSYSEPKGADRVRLTGDALEVANFDRSKGLTSDRVHSIGFDRAGQMWVLNDRGADARLHNAWVHFSQADGLVSNSTVGRAFWSAADGAIWIGSDRGLSRYQPSEVISAGPAPRPEPLHVTFSEVRLGNQSRDPGLERFVETAPERFEAKFSALLLAAGEEAQYRYRIVGFDDAWQETQPQVKFDYLPPGRYRLEVQARREADPWSGPVTVLTLSIRAPWYETWWFRGALLALVCAMVWPLERLRQSKASTARQALERIVNQRTAELRESEERFRNMADTAPVMIWVAEADRLFTFFNKTWLDFTGRNLEQELGAGWAQGVHTDDLVPTFEAFRAAFEARRDFSIEYRLRRADGEYRTVLCRGVPRFAPDGSFVGYIGSDVDITDLRRAQEEAFEKQKLESLGALTGGIAHDFNNLLGSILAEAELAETELESGVSPNAELRQIKSVSIRAAEIVRELMIYSGQDKATQEIVDLSRLVEEMLGLLRVSISKHALLRTDLGKDLLPVLANAAQIRQVVMNLIINASEAIGEKDGVIRVTTSQEARYSDGSLKLAEGDYLRLEVSDTGHGMTEEESAKVFDPFFTTKFAGRGLGLAVVQGIVRAHGGAIRLASTPGKGTTFEIRLPCVRQPAQPPPSIILPAFEEPGVGLKGTVLVVEDEDTLRLAVSKMLRKRGFYVTEAADGSAAIFRLHISGSRIDLILLDATIPGISSPEVLEEARRVWPDVKVILTSAYSHEMATAPFGAQPLQGFIRKPFQLDSLARLLAETITRR
jgi:PAS domain S-box-containing protein